MILNIFTLLLLMVLSQFGVLAQTPDFKPNQLIREIKKTNKTEYVTLNELPLNGSINKIGKFFEIENGTNVSYAYAGRVNSCRAGGCTPNISISLVETYEFFDYFILFDSAAKIVLVRVYNYEATHGQEITLPAWLKQFIGYNGSTQLVVGKNVNAISGATISVYGITNDIISITAKLSNYLQLQAYTNLYGKIQGTTYQVYYKNRVNLQYGIDSIFGLVDTTFSTYNPKSIVSQINNGSTPVRLNSLFINTYLRALQFSEITNGAFDITASGTTASGYHLFTISDTLITKHHELAKLDFNAIAPGLTVDMIALYLEEQHIHDYLVEIGGEIRCKGVNSDNKLWQIGINNPGGINDFPEIENISFSGADMAIATSGTYVKPNHIIDPKTGISAASNIISATVITTNCAQADSYATAFVVMGLEKVKQFVSEVPGIKTSIIYKNENGKPMHCLLENYTPVTK